MFNYGCGWHLGPAAANPLLIVRVVAVTAGFAAAMPSDGETGGSTACKQDAHVVPMFWGGEGVVHVFVFHVMYFFFFQSCAFKRKNVVQPLTARVGCFFFQRFGRGHMTKRPRNDVSAAIASFHHHLWPTTFDPDLRGLANEPPKRPIGRWLEPRAKCVFPV